MDSDVALRLKKRTGFTVKLEDFSFFVQAFKEITQILLQVCLAPWKTYDIQSFSPQLHKIIIDYLFNVT